VDHHQLVREGLESLLSSKPSFEIVGETDSSRAAVELADELRPDVVIMDVNMPSLCGPLATRQLLAKCPHTKVVALSANSDRQSITAMLAAGASAYLLKSCGVEELIHAIDAVMSGRSYISAEISSIVIEGYLRDPDIAARHSSSLLTAREREVLQLLAEGNASKEIARLLHVSVKTVTAHRQNIMDKLQIRSVAELTKYAVREGLTSLDI